MHTQTHEQMQCKCIFQLKTQTTHMTRTTISITQAESVTINILYSVINDRFHQDWNHYKLLYTVWPSVALWDWICHGCNNVKKCKISVMIVIELMHPNLLTRKCVVVDFFVKIHNLNFELTSPFFFGTIIKRNTWITTIIPKFQSGSLLRVFTKAISWTI